MKKAIELNRNGQIIRGILYKPDSVLCPLVILAHGFNGNYNDVVCYAEGLYREGIGALCFDFGDGFPVTLSDGDFENFSIATMADEMTFVVDTVRTWEWVDTCQIGVFGESQGGLVAAIVASRRKQEIAKAALLYPAFSIPDRVRSMFSSAKEIESKEMLGVKLYEPYFRCAYVLDPYEEVKSYENPVLILHGTEDNLVNPKYSERLQKTLPDATIAWFEHCGHGFGEKDERRAVRLVCEFMKKTV
ncbi:MAG: alpha/beta hydrolase [Erysipelotrichaceae bacterium]|nr:alpha/beta hydrolase [Erysipelotrichaceae bacterium]